MPPPGDIRNVLTAMADVEPLMAQIMKYRFSSGEGLAGHSLGNLILAALTDISGDFVTAVRELSRLFAVRGRVLPAAGEAVILHAEMADGTLITGESKIPEAGGVIKRVFLEPVDVEPLPEALELSATQTLFCSVRAVCIPAFCRICWCRSWQRP